MFPLMNAMTKLLTARYPVFEIVWARFTDLVVMLRWSAVCVGFAGAHQTGHRLHKPTVLRLLACALAYASIGSRHAG